MQEDSWTKVMWNSNNKAKNEGAKYRRKMDFAADRCIEISFI